MLSRIDNTLSGGPDPENFNDGCCDSLGQLFLRRLALQPEYIILIDGMSAQAISADQLRNESIRLAQVLQAFGIKAGDTIGICALNCVEFAYVLFGSLLCGATVAPINVTYTQHEIQHAVNLSRPKIIFAGLETHGKIREIIDRNAFIQRVVQFGDEYAEFVQNRIDISTVDFRCTAQPIDENVALILCSSGTTGLPKGVQLTQKNIMIGIEQHAKRPMQMEKLLAPNTITLSIIPWFHAFGCLTLICSMLNQSRIVFLPKFEEKPFLKAISTYRVNTVFMVPPLMVFLAKHPLVDEYDLSSLKVIWCGAAPLSKELENAVQKRLDIPVIRQGYGMTEGTLAFSGQTDEHHTSGSVGVIRAGLKVRFVDVETGINLPANRPGELWIKGSVIMKGYVNDTVSTSHTIDADGWLHTGDIGYYNEEGEIFIVDRLKELIKYKGFQVPPAEIEGILLQHPRVFDAGVIGKPDEYAGELPIAFIVKRPGAELSEQEVLQFVAERVSSAKRIHEVHFIHTIPKNPSGKVLRRELRAIVQNTRSKL